MERTTRRLALTEAGETFHQRMRGALSALQEIEQDTAATAASVRGTLRIALPATFGRMWVAPILPAFLAAHPDVTVEAAFEDRYVDLVAESFDVAIRIGTLTDSRLVARRLAPRGRAPRPPICARPAGPAGRSGSPCLPGFPRLASHPLWHLREDDKVTSVRISGPLVTDDAHSLCRPPLPARASPWCPTGWPAPNCAAASWCPCCPNIPCKTARRFTWCILPRAWFRQDAGIRRLDLGGAGRQAVAASWIHAAMTYCRQAPHAHMKQSRHRVAAVSIAAMWPWRLALKPRHPA